MLDLWPYIEADFQRDYGLDLSSVDCFLPLSWRRFNVLLGGLSSYGSTATHYDAVAKKRKAEAPVGKDRGAEDFWRLVAMTSKPSEK